jgi:hypothetical protein
MSLTKKEAVQILNSRKLIVKPGKVTLRATSVNPFQREDGTLVMIVNFNAMTNYQLGKARELFAAGDFDGACNLNMSASQLQGRFVPSKGETVDVEITEIYSDKAEANILVVDSIIPRQAEAAPSVKFSFDEVEVEEAAELV